MFFVCEYIKKSFLAIQVIAEFMVNRRSFFFEERKFWMNSILNSAQALPGGSSQAWFQCEMRVRQMRKTTGTLSLQEATQIKCGNSRGPLSEIYSFPKGANMWIKNIHLSWKTNYYFFFLFRMRQCNVSIKKRSSSISVQWCDFYVPLISVFCLHLWQRHIFISFHIMPAVNTPEPLLSPMQFRCCGVTNHTDWFEVYNTTRVPDSCCLEYSDNCGQDNPGTWWTAVSLGNIFIPLVDILLSKSSVSTIYWNLKIEIYEKMHIYIVLFCTLFTK